MKRLYETEAIPFPPNTHCYTAVINCCAFCLNDNAEKREALRIALETYKELERTPDYGKANHVTFATMIGALSNLLPPSSERTAAIETIFNRAKECGQVDHMIIRRVQTSLTPAEMKKVCPGVKMSQDGLSNIPSDWQRNMRRNHN